MQRLQDLVGGLPGFNEYSHADRLRLFAWVLHAEGRATVRVSDLAACFTATHVRAPANLHRAVDALKEQGDFLRSTDGYRLSKPVRDQLDGRYGKRPTTVQVHNLLAALPGRLSSAAQREYLEEAFKCFRAGAWRGAIVMTWNVAFDHLCDHALGRLSDLNAAFPKAFPKLAEHITTRAELRELKESVVIRICRTVSVRPWTA
jgi:hypothetical protein